MNINLNVCFFNTKLMLRKCYCLTIFISIRSTRMYQKVSGLSPWSEKCKLYSSLPLGPVVSIFCESQSGEFCRHNPLRCFLTSVYCCSCLFLYQLNPETSGYTLVYVLCEKVFYTFKVTNNFMKIEGWYRLQGCK